MSANDIDTIRVDIQGNAKAEAQATARELNRMEGALAKLGGTAGSVKGGNFDSWMRGAKGVHGELDEIAAMQAKLANFDGARVKKVADLQAKYKQMHESATKLSNVEKIAAAHSDLLGRGGFVNALAGSGKLAVVSNLFGKMFGDKAKASLVEGAAKLGGAFDKMGATPEMLSAAGGAVLKGGTIVLQAAAALAAAGAAVGIAGYKFGVEKTSEKELQTAIFGKMGAKGGFELAVKLAADFNLDEGDAISKVKQLANAKFSKSEVPVLMKISAGMDLVKSGSGGEFLQELEKMKLKPHVDSKDIKGFAGMGIQTKDVYAQLAKQLGVSVPVAMAKVKAGAVDTEKVLRAIENVGGKAFGPLAEQAGNTVPALLNKLKIRLASLFDDMDLAPLKEFLRNVNGTLAGAEGAELKRSMKELFGNVSETIFGPFKGKDGMLRMKQFTANLITLIHALSKEAKDAGPAVKKFYDEIGAKKADPNKSVGDIVKDQKWKEGAWGGAMKGGKQVGLGILLGPLGPLVSILGEMSDLFDKAGADSGSKLGAGLGKGIKSAGLGIMFGPLFPMIGALSDFFDGSATQAGTNLSAGVTNGIEGGQSGAVNAAVRLVQAAIAAANGAADAHSPSRKMAKLGGFMGQGLTGGMDAQNDNAAGAGARMAQAAMGGAGASAGGAAGGAGGAGAGGGGSLSLTMNIHPPAGMTEAQAAAVGKAASDAAYQAWQAHDRRNAREKRERGR